MEQPKNHDDLELLKSKKMETHYKVKDAFEAVTKDVDFSKRVVKVIPNTYFFFDSDQDVLLPGCAAKSFLERGPDSTGVKIKNVYGHDLNLKIGVPKVLEEKKMGDKHVQYAESKMLTTTKGNDTLIEYQEGAIDNHSIGFQYKILDFISADEKDWKKWVDQLINPEEAEKFGYMFLVKEILQFEFSPVAFGANSLTPYLGVKSQNKEAMILKTFERIDFLETQYKVGRQSDETLQDYQLQSLQLKQIISELFEVEPSLKDTLIRGRRNQDTNKKDTSLTICSNCLKQFNYNTIPESGIGYVKCPNCGQFVDQEGNFTVQFDLSKAIKETTFIKI